MRVGESNEPEMLSTGAVARELGVSTNHVRELIDSGDLEAIDVSRGTVVVYRVSRSSLDAFKANRAKKKSENGENGENGENKSRHTS